MGCTIYSGPIMPMGNQSFLAWRKLNFSLSEKPNKYYTFKLVINCSLSEKPNKHCIFKL